MGKSYSPNLLVLGAASDIGREVAELFGRNGYTLTLAARQEASLQKIAADIRIRTRSEVHTVLFDALHTDSHADFYQNLPIQPDVVVCVFGLLGDQSQAEQSFEHARRIIDTNYTGAVSILHIVAAHFAERKRGIIVGVSSVAGDRGRQSNYVYGSAKAAFTAFLSGLRNRLYPHGVHVCTILPGFVRTKMTLGLKLPGPLTAEPSEVARAVYMACRTKANVVYTLWMWRYIMWVIKSIPEGIFKKLKL
jgi:short-subunit dehydrogenase